MGLSPQAVASERDAQVVRLVAQLRFARSDHVGAILFGGRHRVANRRLLRLVETQRLRRERLGEAGAYVYSLPGQRPGRTVAEALAVADLFVALRVNRPPGWSVESFVVEWQDGPVRPDAILTAAHTATGERAVGFWEWDAGTTSVPKAAGKVDAYLRYAASGAYRKAWWWRDGLRPVIVIATAEARVAALQKAAQAPEELNLRVVSHREALANPWRLIIGQAAPARAAPPEGQQRGAKQPAVAARQGRQPLGRAAWMERGGQGDEALAAGGGYEAQEASLLSWKT